MARANSRCKDGPLANSPSFLEAEISLPTVHRLTDDDVVKHLDLNPFCKQVKGEIRKVRGGQGVCPNCGAMGPKRGVMMRR